MQALQVLLVEDSPDDAELLLRELRHAGYEPRWTRVETAAGFLAELEKSPDIILCDYAMPDFSGLRAMQLLRASGREIPLILISGTVGEDVAVEAMRQGVTDYLLKDRLVRLRPAIERALKEKKMRADQIQAERTLHHKEQEQRQLAERLVQAQEAGKVGSWETDLQTLQVVWSEQMHQIFETDPATFRPTHAAFLERVHSEDRGMVSLAFDNSLRDEQRRLFAIEHQICLPAAGNKIVEERWQVFRDERGQPVRAAGTCQDITERRKLEAQLRQAQKMEAVGLLAGGVAHDFNNILAIIQMQAGMLKLGTGLSVGQVELVNEIENTTQRAAALIRQLLLFSRREIFQPQELDLNVTITQMVKLLQRILRADIRLELKLAAAPVVINADAAMLDQVIMNLVINARDALPQGGRLSIETAVVEIDNFMAAQLPRARAGRFACLSVSDTGTGIAPEILPRIFEPFFTTKDVGQGTGLGLATVFGIVQQHQGWINVSTEVGQGSTFRIYFPRQAKTATELNRPLATEYARGGRETILLVEDDKALCQLLELAFQQLGYNVFAAHSGAEALAIWEQHRREIDLLFTDLIMPSGMHGRELACQLQQFNAKLKVIYVSGSSADIIGENFHVQEGIDFIKKPFEINRLAQIIRQRFDGGHS